MTPQEIGETVLRARTSNGWSQEKLADEAGGVGQSTIDRIEKGDFKRMPSDLPRICRALGIPLPQLGIGPVAGYVIDLSEKPDALGPLPVHSAAQGGPGEIIRSAEPIDFVPRPSPLTHVRDAYGLIITGESMVPEFKPGETALVNPALPIIGGEVYIFYAEREGEARATIKELRRQTVSEWYVHQHNPPPRRKPDFTLDRGEWRIVHRVIGKYSRQ